MQMITQRMLHRLNQERHEVLALVVCVADEVSDATVLRGKAIEEDTVTEIVSAVWCKYSKLLRKIHEDRRQVIERGATTQLFDELPDR